jgi:hypothetical protein
MTTLRASGLSTIVAACFPTPSPRPFSLTGRRKWRGMVRVCAPSRNTDVITYYQKCLRDSSFRLVNARCVGNREALFVQQLGSFTSRMQPNFLKNEKPPFDISALPTPMSIYVFKFLCVSLTIDQTFLQYFHKLCSFVCLNYQQNACNYLLFAAPTRFRMARWCTMQ